MGILDDLLGSEKKTYKENPAPVPPNLNEVGGSLGLSIKFLPLRLSAKKDNQVDMLVSLHNKTEETQLLSFEAFLPPREMVGFDRTVIRKHYEKKLGNIGPGQKVDFAVPIYATSQTRPGNYQVGVLANVHYMDYTKLMPTGVKRKIFLRVV
ncbi:hypothetical protein KJ780_00855 [Candidatus Micrarchaeota archaeon]|nr:hypothetical protein [Candidatus Micrarchaeota archaeon]